MSSAGSRRTKFQIFADILEAIRINIAKHGAARMTNVHSRSNVRYDRFQAYLDEMEKLGLIDRTMDEKERISITIRPRGFELLKEYKRVRKFLVGFGIEKPRHGEDEGFEGEFFH